jgi:hypothetical protein
VSIGFGVTNQQGSAVGIGFSVTAREEGVAIGSGSVNQAAKGVAIGRNADCDLWSVSVGAYANSGQYSVAIGNTAEAAATSGYQCVAIGDRATANAIDAYAFGAVCTVTHNGAIVFGVSASSTAVNQLVLGGRHIELTEMTEPAAPAADKIRLYAVDDGGVTKLRYRTSAGITEIGAAGGNLTYSAKTANYTLTGSDRLINCTSGTFTLTLPTAVGSTGRVYDLKNTGSGVITLNTTSSQTIDANASGALTLNQWDNLTVVSDGANWIII